MSLASASIQPDRKSVLRRIAEIVDRVLQNIVLFAFYYVPVSFALLNPFLRRSDVRGVHAGIKSVRGRALRDLCSVAAGRHDPLVCAEHAGGTDESRRSTRLPWSITS